MNPNKKTDSERVRGEGFMLTITPKSIVTVLNGIWKITLLIILFLSMNALFDIANMTYFAITGGETPNGARVPSVSLTSTEWYKQRVFGKVDDVNKLFTLDLSNYIVYFRQDNCSFCEQAEAEIVKWLEAGNDSKVSFIFVDMASNAHLWSEDPNFVTIADPSNFYIAGTPTFLHKKPDGTFEVGVGPEFLIDIFKGY